MNQQNQQYFFTHQMMDHSYMMLRILCLLPLVLLVACGGGGAGTSSDDSFIDIRSAYVSQSERRIDSLELSDGQAPIMLVWQVNFSNPSRLYSMTVNAIDNNGFTQRLLYQNCGASSGGLYRCDSRGQFNCQVSDNLLDCRIDGVGNTSRFTTGAKQLRFDACIYDQTVTKRCSTRLVNLNVALNAESGAGEGTPEQPDTPQDPDSNEPGGNDDPDTSDPGDSDPSQEGVLTELQPPSWETLFSGLDPTLVPPRVGEE